MSDGIRNIIQTHQERTVIKQAPDLIVYIDGLPYLRNNWTHEGVAIVNFNDFVVSSSGAADLNTPIPGATVQLSIPNHQKYQFTAPGGNTPFYTMAEIKIFVKGYYMTLDGQSVYHRVFWGVITNISQAEGDTSLEVTLSCKGILHLMDLMQFNTAPSIMTSEGGGSAVTPFSSILQPLNPIQGILAMFMTQLGDAYGNINTIDPNTLDQTSGSAIGAGGSQANSNAVIQDVYVSKWNRHLKNLNKGVRLAGISVNVSDIVMQPIPTNFSVATDTGKARDATFAKNGTTENNWMTQFFPGSDIWDAELIKDFLPSFGMGTVTMMDSVICTRLAKVQELVTVIGWEFYQDIDGSVIIKPPLYNINPLNTRCSDPNRNPFIINLDERIGSDSLVEDASQVVRTRVAVKGTMQASDDVQIAGADVNIIPVGVFADPILIRQFGLKFEGVKEVPYIGNHSNQLYAYAVSELARSNKGWKTYTVTIPMRPELRLGFCVHIPWRDLMGYLENISWTYTRGNSASMTLTMAYIRTRELHGALQPPSSDGSVPRFVYAPITNAILQWCKPLPGTQAPGTPAASQGIKNTIATRPSAADPTIVDQWNSQTMLMAAVTGYQPPVAGVSWVIQDDKGFGNGANASPDPKAAVFALAGITDIPAFKAKWQTDFFSKKRPVDASYLLTVQTYAMPYTDNLGYTLVRPFPWGRFTRLETALDLFTRPRVLPPILKPVTGGVLPFETLGATTDTAASATAASVLQNATDAFLLTGLGTPSVAAGSGSFAGGDSSVLQQLTSISSFMQDNVTCFVVSYPSQEDPNASGLSPNPFNATQIAAVASNNGNLLGLTESMTANQATAFAASMVDPTTPAPEPEPVPAPQLTLDPSLAPYTPMGLSLGVPLQQFPTTATTGTVPFSDGVTTAY